MSKSAQEGTSKDGSAVAKPRPLNLVSRNLMSAKKFSPQGSSDPNSPENQELDQRCVLARSRNLLRDINQNPTIFKFILSWSTRILVRSCESASSGS